MIVLLSPAKTLDLTEYKTQMECNSPRLLNDSTKLLSELKKCSKKDLEKLMSVSSKIATNVYGYINDFKKPFNKNNAKPAIMAFKGDVYKAFDFEKYKANDLKFMDKHVRILSGFYGLLTPFDLIQPYRLEMGTNLKNPKGKNLYEFWDKKIAKLIDDDVKKSKSQVVINLASNEYFKAVQLDSLNVPVVNIDFKEKKGNSYKTIGLLAKRARGMMTDYIVSHKIKNVKDLLKFSQAGYKYNKKMSTENNLVYVR